MLLNDTDLKKQINVNASFTHELLVPDIRNIENREIKKILGNTLYVSLDAAYLVDPNAMSAIEKAVMAYVQPVIANLAMWQYAGKGTVQIDDNGFSVTSSEEKKPASEVKIENFKQSCMNTGFNAIDDLVEFLEENAADYPDWVAEAATLTRAFFINSAKVFHEYVNIRESRRMFLLIMPIMRRVETQEITAAICKELFDEIKDQIESQTLSPANTLLLPMLKGAAAHMTWSKSLKELALTVNDEGIHLFNNSFSGTIKALTPSETGRIRAVQDDHEETGMSYLETLKDYLQANAGTYPLYLASECYIDVDNDETDEFENDPESGMIMF